VTAVSLTGFVKANVSAGATIMTDGWQGYAPLRGMGAWAIAIDIDPAPRATLGAQGRSCRAFTACSATCRPGCEGRTTA